MTLTKDQFLKDVASHEMSVLRDNGLYRHVRFGRPNTCNMRFDLVTWPWHLCYCGDMGTYVFSRIDDMFRFFRRKDGEINEGYWSEKLEATDRHGGLFVFDKEKFSQIVEEWLDDVGADSEIRESVHDQVLSGVDDYDDREAHRTLSEFSHGDFAFHDSYELDFNRYADRFIWCCCAISWGINLYDSRNSEAA